MCGWRWFGPGAKPGRRWNKEHDFQFGMAGFPVLPESILEQLRPGTKCRRAGRRLDVYVYCGRLPLENSFFQELGIQLIKISGSLLAGAGYSASR